MTKRRAITDGMKWRTLISRGVYIRCAVCNIPTQLETLEFDHVHAVVFDGPHVVGNLRPLCVPCHKAKTKRDVRDNAHVKRLRGEFKPKRKRVWASRPLQSRPFEKRKDV